MWLYLSYFPFRAPAHSNCTDLDVYGSVISHISSEWSRDSNPSSFQYRVSWTLRSTNMECTSVEYILPGCPWISWSKLLPKFMEVCLAYSWTYFFARSVTSGSLLLGKFLWVCIWGSWYHRWELPGNYPVFTVVMLIYHYVERIWRIIVTPNLLYNIYIH